MEVAGLIVATVPTVLGGTALLLLLTAAGTGVTNGVFPSDAMLGVGVVDR